MKYFKTGGYCREFRPHGRGRNYLLDRIPVPLWTRVREKAKANKVSLRAVILRLLTNWVEEASCSTGSEAGSEGGRGSTSPGCS